MHKGLTALGNRRKMKTKKKDVKKAMKYKKAPDAPKRFKSAFIIFSAEKHKEIKKDLLDEGKAVKTTDIAKMVSEAWKKLDPDARKDWDDKADRDKQRYEAEKAMYKGPWKIPSNKRKTKDPSAPKRPMSAFLAYSNSRRAELKRSNPKATNADLSRMLSKTWKELPPTERAVYMAEERELREQYKTKMSDWRTKVAEEKKVEREEREVAAMQAAEAGQTHQGMDPDAVTPNRGPVDSKWVGSMQQQHHEDVPNQQFQQQGQPNPQQQQVPESHPHVNEMAPPGMFANPYFPAAAFGGAGQAALGGLNPASANPYLVNAFAANQGYMQGGNPAMSSLFGGQPPPYMPNGGMPGQMHPGLYGHGPNFAGGGGGMQDSGAGPNGGYGQMQP
ncbi:group protein B3 [Seminavis robusta]|uniref:Group protein B3 n=1 Tax=Seminavis robusta TaxID=568900 RepID=A0A9N8HMK3_9STRA|nr:group protein B3 [Seminavis robusta]|eukprot:Sro752_g197240.1 group protein B3 (389) ;mRNA; r:39894-41860